MGNRILSSIFISCLLVFLPLLTPGAQLAATEMAAGADQTDQELRSAAGIMRIYAIDVGQGDSALVVFPDGSNMMIDFGRSSKVNNIKSLLGRLGIGKINRAVVTHTDSDHDGGYPSLQSSGYIDSSTQRYDWTNTSPGDVFYSSGAVTVTCVSANGYLIGGGYVNPGGSTNDGSVGVVVRFRGFDYLSCGDLENKVEKPLGAALAARNEKIDVLKVDHHGSAGSSSLQFLQKIMPEFAVIMVGSNSYGHPTQEAIDHLNDPTVHVQRIFQTEIGNGGTASNVTVANGQIVTTTDGATYTFTNEGPGSTSFSYGPYQVDEPVCEYEEQPPHLMITEVGIGAHTFPENHDWVELYFPMDAQSIDLRSVYVTDLDYVSPIATSAVTLIPGDVVILHDVTGQSENDATGKGANGWWDMFDQFSGPGNTWNAYDDELVISSNNTLTPTQADIIDAVVWSNYDGSMFQDQADDGNYLINNCHWGDPTVGSGLFTTTNEGPAIGDIDNGYPQRITTIDTNSKGDWQISPTNSEGTPPPPPLAIIPSPLTVGEQFTLGILLTQDLNTPFDPYILADTPAGVYNIRLNGLITPGITPLFKNVLRFDAPFATTILPTVRIPASMKAKTVTFYTAVVEAGKVPPVRNLEELSPNSPYVIMMDKKTVIVN